MTTCILITGGAGFIGSHLVEACLRAGAVVRVLDNLATGHRENLTKVVEESGRQESFTFIEGDISDPKAVYEAVKGATYVLHQAALPSVQRSVEDPLSSNQTNVEGTLNLLLAARDTGVQRVVNASSSSVYGDSVLLPKAETMSTSPQSPYAVSKLAAEAYCRVFSHVYGLETVSLRYFNVFGPRQDPLSPYAAVVPRFIEALLLHKQPVIYGDGLQSRDFTYIDHVVQANMLAIKATGVTGEVFNIACGQSISLQTMLQVLTELSGQRVDPQYSPPRAGDVRHSLADISKAERLLGYHPGIPFRDALRRTWEYYHRRRE